MNHHLSQRLLAWEESFDAFVWTTSSAICPSFVRTPDDSSGRTRAFLATLESDRLLLRHGYVAL